MQADHGCRSGWCCSVETTCERIVELCVDGREQVAVGAEGDVDRRVAHALHDRSGVGALGDEEGGVGVSQVVEACLSGKPGSDGRPRDETPRVAAVADP